VVFYLNLFLLFVPNLWSDQQEDPKEKYLEENDEEKEIEVKTSTFYHVPAAQMVRYVLHRKRILKEL
jgi:hypothetical protein